MKAYRVTVTETRITTAHVLASSPEDAEFIAETAAFTHHYYWDEEIDSSARPVDAEECDVEEWETETGCISHAEALEVIASAPPEPCKITIPLPLDTP